MKQNKAFTLAEGASHGAFFTNKRRSAFTLAEVLITLGIIGIVAAMTLPNLLGNYRKNVTENKLKVAYSNISNALQTINVQNDLNFIPEEFNEYNSGTWSYELSKSVFEHYFAPNLKIVKTFNQENRFEVCNPDYIGCYKNPSYQCVILPDNIGLCFAISYPKGSLAFQIITNPSKTKLIAGKDVFGINIPRDITNNDFNMNIKISFIANIYTPEKRKFFINNCISTNAFPFLEDGQTVSSTDREFWCTFLVEQNGLKIPDDYPIKF